MTIEETSDPETEESVLEDPSGYSVREVSVGGEAGSGTEIHQNHLLYGETELVELPQSTSFMVHYGVTHVYEGANQDIVLVTQIGECGGCVAFLDQYYIVKKPELNVEVVPFLAPEDVNLFYNGAVYSNTVFADQVNELAFVNEVGDIYKQPSGDLNEAYYEEVWSYSFDRQTWQLAYTTKPGESVQCDNYMGWDVDPDKLRYWKEALVTSPQVIEADFEKNLCS